MKYFYTLVALGLTGLMFIPSPSSAENCQSSRPVVVSRPTYSYSPSYTPAYSPTVTTIVVKEKEIVPVAVPILIPATVFQYLPAVTPAVSVVNPSISQSQPQQQLMYQQPQAPLQQQQQLQPQAQQAAPTAEIDRLIRERLDAILKEYQAGKPQSGLGDGPPPLTFEQEEAPAVKKTSKDVGWIATLKTSCIRCHQKDKSPKDGIVLFDRNGRFAPNVSDQTIVRVIKDGSMPKNTTLNTATKQALLAPFEG